MSSKASTLAKDIRGGATGGGVSGEYSLSGFQPNAIVQLVSEAFSEEILCTEMIRCTFVVGGGKKVRAHFHPDVGVALSRALTEQGFSEDRGASCALDSQGTFKFQHNTDTDLKTITVFPRVQVVETKVSDRPALWEVDEMDVLATDPALLCAKCSMLSFITLVVEMCPTFTQRYVKKTSKQPP